MIKRLNEAFSLEEHEGLVRCKEVLRKKLGVGRLNWHDYFLHISGVKKVGK